MDSNLQKIVEFIEEHYVMSLATTYDNELSVCSLFYLYDISTHSFIVASSEETRHIQHIKKNKEVAGNILLEIAEVSQIQGLQFNGIFLALEDEKLQELYKKKFPAVKEIQTKFWQIHVQYFKMTDNRLGFGTKIIVSDFSF